MCVYTAMTILVYTVLVSLCTNSSSNIHRHRRSSAHLDLPLRTGTRSSTRYEPYPTSGKRGMRELATPGTLHLTNTPILNIKRRLSKPGLPMWVMAPLSWRALATFDWIDLVRFFSQSFGKALKNNDVFRTEFVLMVWIDNIQRYSVEVFFVWKSTNFFIL